MRLYKDKKVIKAQRRFYADDLEHFDWLCKINGIDSMDMLHDMLRVYPQANAEKESKTCGEAHILKEIIPSPQN